MDRLKELYDKWQQALATARSLADEAEKAEGESRTEKLEAARKAADEAFELRDRVEAERKLEEQERSAAELAAELEKADNAEPGQRRTRAEGEERRRIEDGTTEGENRFASEPREIRELAQMVARAQGEENPFDERAIRRLSVWFRSLSPHNRKDETFRREVRDLQADADISGGYTVPPPMFVAQLLKGVDDQTFIRQFGNVLRVTSSDSIGVPSLDTDPADADWNSEVGAVSADTAMAFGGRELKPIDSDKLIKVSEKLLRVSALSPEALVRQRMEYKLGVTHEKGFLTGTGANQPLGLFVASADGISTGRDVSTDNNTDSPTFDNAIRSKYTLKGQYWPRARWVMHRDVALQYALVKDGEGQYIWRESVRAGEPDRLLGFPVSLSEFAPNTLTTGKYVAILGDLSFYWIAENVGAFYLKRLDELYAANKQVGFIIHSEIDGQPALEEAFVRVKLA